MLSNVVRQSHGTTSTAIASIAYVVSLPVLQLHMSLAKLDLRSCGGIASKL